MSEEMFKPFDDFIWYNDNALPQSSVDDILSTVNDNSEALEQFRIKQVEAGIAGVAQSPLVRDDTTYFMSPYFNKLEHLQWVDEALRLGFNEYHAKYPFMWNAENVHWGEFKYHIVRKNGGYHSWHHEKDGAENRLLVFHLSLTTHKNEGELEFLYLGHRIEPKAGRLLIFPAHFTHVHRGNSIRTDTVKQYITGWYLTH